MHATRRHALALIAAALAIFFATLPASAQTGGKTGT